MSYVFHPVAEVEHLESVVWYESKRPGLGAHYLSEFGIMAYVCEAPYRYPIEKDDIRAQSTFVRFLAPFTYWRLRIIAGDRVIG